jgi:hypothetical protein
MSRLQDDLLQDFREQKAMISEQIDIFDPLGTQLRKPAARRLVSRTALIASEVFFYLLALSAIAVGLFMDRIYPLSVLSDVRYSNAAEAVGKTNMANFAIAFYALLGIVSVLSYIIARSMRKIRLKNSILYFAGKHINTLVEQHLKRKAAILTIEQRHFTELPFMTAGSNEDILVSDVANPAY